MRLHVQVELLGGEVAPQLQREHRLRGRGVVQLELQLGLVDVEGAAVPVNRSSGGVTFVGRSTMSLNVFVIE